MAAGVNSTIHNSGRHFNGKDLHEYLKTLPRNILDRLYNHPATCLAVFRELPELAKHYIMRTSFTEQPVPETLVSAWIKIGHHREHTEAINRLKNLRIWREVSTGVPLRYELNPTFKSNLKVVFCGGGSPWAGSTSQLGSDKHARDVTFLHKYATERWESVLHFMAGSQPSSSTQAVSQDIVQILISSGLMSCESRDQPPTITQAGFQFLLMDTASQVWYFMLQYLETVQTRGMDLVACLSFLFQLSFSDLGKDYPTDGMNESQFAFLQHLREFGLVFQRKRKSRRYYPTRLAINLASAGSGKLDVSSSQRDGYIVVETNYRVYAYTDSCLQAALIGLFCTMTCRFPNFCVGVITRESIHQALKCGITADQILHFLRTRSHPEMVKQTPILPPTVCDQIKLWEMERTRMKFSDGVLYNQFLSLADFEVVRKYAEDLGVLTWANSNKRVMIVSKAGHDDVKRFWKRQKHS